MKSSPYCFISQSVFPHSSLHADPYQCTCMTDLQIPSQQLAVHPVCLMCSLHWRAIYKVAWFTLQSLPIQEGCPPKVRFWPYLHKEATVGYDEAYVYSYCILNTRGMLSEEKEEYLHCTASDIYCKLVSKGFLNSKRKGTKVLKKHTLPQVLWIVNQKNNSSLLCTQMA